MRRIQMQLSGPAETMLNQMEKRLGAKAKDLITDALAYYDWASESVQDGFKVGRFDPNEQTFESMTTQTLRAAAKKVTQQEERELVRQG